MERNYVICSTRHKSMFGGFVMLFWGSRTKDNEERSFGGYTSDIEKCENYTLEELKGENYPIIESTDAFMDMINQKFYGDMIINKKAFESCKFLHKATILYF